MQSMIEGCLGEPRPKQYCAFTGSRSMLQHTADRAKTLVPEDRIVTVLGKGHRKFLSEQNGNGRQHPGAILEQPLDRGTAPGVYFGLSHISQFDPRATVLLLPSDHFAYPESRFLHYLANAFRLAERDSKNTLFLLGVQPNRPDNDYGWIESEGNRIDRDRTRKGIPIQSVRSFYEKPEPSLALALYHRQCLWNTMIVAGKVETFWRLLDKHLPRTSMEFRLLQAGFDRRGPMNLPNHLQRSFFSSNGVDPAEVSNGIPHQPMDGLRMLPIADVDWCEAIYRGMGAADFSADILQQETENLRVVPMKDVDWCDWGRPERVMASLRKIGVGPSFPFRLLGALG